MFKNGSDYPVAGFPGKSLCNHVDCFGGIFGKYRDASFTSYKLWHFIIGMPVTLGRDLGKAVNTPADIGTITVFELNHCIDNRLRGKTCCRVIQVDDVTENREILADLVNVKSRISLTYYFCFHTFSCLFFDSYLWYPHRPYPQCIIIIDKNALRSA